MMLDSTSWVIDFAICLRGLSGDCCGGDGGGVGSRQSWIRLVANWMEGRTEYWDGTVGISFLCTAQR